MEKEKKFSSETQNFAEEKGKDTNCIDYSESNLHLQEAWKLLDEMHEGRPYKPSDFVAEYFIPDF